MFATSAKIFREIAVLLSAGRAWAGNSTLTRTDTKSRTMGVAVFRTFARIVCFSPSLSLNFEDNPCANAAPASELLAMSSSIRLSSCTPASTKGSACFITNTSALATSRFVRSTAELGSGLGSTGSSAPEKLVASAALLTMRWMCPSQSDASSAISPAAFTPHAVESPPWMVAYCALALAATAAVVEHAVVRQVTTVSTATTTAVTTAATKT